MKFNRRVFDTPHPAILPRIKRIWLDATDRNNTIFNGSDIQSLLKKDPNSLSVTQNTAVNQPADNIAPSPAAGSEVFCDDSGNNQFLDAGSDYPFVAATHGGASIFFLARNSQTTTQKFICDFGNFLTRGWGVFYTPFELGCYTPADFGGAYTYIRYSPFLSVDYTRVGCVIKFNDSQKLYINNNLEKTANITLSQLTSSEINQASTHLSASGPFTICAGSKVPPSSRWYKGAIKIILMLLGPVSDYQRRIVDIYLRNKELV